MKKRRINYNVYLQPVIFTPRVLPNAKYRVDALAKAFMNSLH